MLDKGANLKLQDDYGRNALYSCSNNDSMLRYLLALPGIVVQDTDKFGLNILAYLQPEILDQKYRLFGCRLAIKMVHKRGF